MTTLFTALRSLKLPNKCFASIDKVNTQYSCKQIFMILLLLPLFAVQDVSHITGSPLGTLCQCRSKKLSCKHYEAEAEIKGIEVKLFFCKMPKNSKWHSLLTTNRALAFEDAFDIYATRWTIEVFFKECKQLLRLGKCEARSFEAQIAATTLCMLQHNMLSMVKRFDGYESLGALFRASKAEALELTVKERICKVIKEILAHIAIKMNLELDFLVEYMCSENEQLKNILNSHFPTRTA